MLVCIHRVITLVGFVDVESVDGVLGGRPISNSEDADEIPCAPWWLMLHPHLRTLSEAFATPEANLLPQFLPSTRDFS